MNSCCAPPILATLPSSFSHTLWFETEVLVTKYWGVFPLHSLTGTLRSDHWPAWRLHRRSALWCQGNLPPRTAPRFPIGALVHFSFFLLNNEGLGRILEGRRCLD